MNPPKSDARQTLQDEAFERLDQLDIPSLHGVSMVRIAALAHTTVQYVDSWITARGHHSLRRANRKKNRR